MFHGGGWGWKPYVSKAERLRKAMREMDQRKKQGQAVSPVIVEGRAIATTFWGKAWCENLERYSDYSNRLPRGRTYVRGRAVIDLQISGGTIEALVSGSEIYEVAVKVSPVTKARWKSVCADCAGGIDSLVELLQGRLSKNVMERICRQNEGLFPSSKEIRFSCTCPDGAYMCKHVAAVLYGIGARFDKQPELLFRLHQVDEKELIANAGKGLSLVVPPVKKGSAATKVLGGEDLSELFGLDIADSPAEKPKRAKAPVTKKAVKAKRAAVKKPKVKATAKTKRRQPPRT